MKVLRYTYWKEDDYFIGYLNDYPDYQTQGLSKEELIDNLKEILKDIEADEIPYLRNIPTIRRSSHSRFPGIMK
jgi:predicted RNase H-like HicB family nuclease